MSCRLHPRSEGVRRLRRTRDTTHAPRQQISMHLHVIETLHLEQ